MPHRCDLLLVQTLCDPLAHLGVQRYIDKLKSLLSQSGERESSPAYGELNHLVNTRVSASCCT